MCVCTRLTIRHMVYSSSPAHRRMSGSTRTRPADSTPTFQLATLPVSTISPAVFSQKELKHAIAIHSNGLVSYPPTPIKFTHTPVRPYGDQMWLRCIRCQRRRPHGHFDYIEAANSISITCISCKQNPPPKPPKPWRAPRMTCMSNTGVLHMFCRPCGKYVTTDNVEPSRLRDSRRMCLPCHAKSIQTAQFRPYTPARRLKPGEVTLATTTKQCRKCLMYSTTRICASCRLGVEPVSMGIIDPSRRNVNLVSAVLSSVHMRIT